MEEQKPKELKKARARKLGTLTRTRRRAFIIIESKGSRTELTKVLKELDLALEAVQEAHDHCTTYMSEEEDISNAQKYIEDVDKQYSEAVERIRTHLEARKDEAPSVVSAIGRPASSGVSERSDVARAREAEIQERLKKVELAQIQKRLQLEQQEQELKRKRILQEAADAHQRAEMEASIQKAALDDLQWERRNDFNDHPDAPEDKEVHAPEMAVNAGSDHDKKSSGT